MTTVMTLLIMTVGQTDVQLVFDGARRELHKERCAVLHDEIAQRGYILDDAPDKKGNAADALPEGELRLCVPKLDAVLREEHPTAVLILETRRDAVAAPGDPRLAGAVLEARLSAQGIGTVFRCSYLQGAERLEDRDEPRDAVIRRDVVRRIESAVRKTIDNAKPTRILVAATGGFPVVSQLVEEIVRLHATVPVEAIEIADGTRMRSAAPDRVVVRTRIPEPGVSFQARRRALELLESGNLLGAWAVAEPLHDDEVEQQWTRVVNWLARFSSSLPIPEDCDLDVLRHKCMAVRAALRVELALRAGDIPKAVHGTVAFFEAALWDGLNERVERSEVPDRRRYFRIKNGDPPSGNKLLRQGDGTDDDRKRPFEFKDEIDGIAWYWIYDSDGGPAARLAKYYLKRDRLLAFDKALSSEIRALRNDVAHNEPTPSLMDEARRIMTVAGLWSEGHKFLTQQLVKEVLAELDVQHADQLCINLLSTVRKRLLAVTQDWTPMETRPSDGRPESAGES